MTMEKQQRKKFTTGAQERFRTGCGNIYVYVGLQEGMQPFEVFVTIAKPGACGEAFGNGLGRMCSLALRSGIAPEDIIAQLGGIQCRRPAWERAQLNLSCADCVAKALKRVVDLRDKYRAGDAGVESVEAVEPIEIVDPNEFAELVATRLEAVPAIPSFVILNDGLRDEPEEPPEAPQPRLQMPDGGAEYGWCSACQLPLVNQAHCIKCPNCSFEECG